MDFHQRVIRLGNGFPTEDWEVNLARTEAPVERRKTGMKKNLRGKIREFLKSEEGKVGIKSPLTLGVATGSLPLAQAVVGTPQAEAWMCVNNHDCAADEKCSVGTCVPR